jgi:hypothetical protein
VRRRTFTTDYWDRRVDVYVQLTTTLALQLVPDFRISHVPTYILDVFPPGMFLPMEPSREAPRGYERGDLSS